MKVIPTKVILPPPIRLDHVRQRGSGPAVNRIIFRLSDVQQEQILEACEEVNLNYSEFVRWATVSAAIAINKWKEKDRKGDAAFTGGPD